MAFKTWVLAVLALIALLGVLRPAHTGVLYTNNAGVPLVQSFDTTTGAMIFSFTGSGDNGRGVATLGDEVYTSDADTGFVGRFDRATGVSLGGFTVAAAQGISALSFDGNNFWVGDYGGSNNAFYVSPTGAVLKTIALSESEGFYDGLEFFNGKLIANAFGGGLEGGNQYSIYNTDGVLLVKDFIDTTGHGNGSGIAFDGTNFYISDIFNGRATIWSGVDGSFLGELALIGTKDLVVDLSFDFETRPDTCRVNCGPGGEVPEPGSMALMGLGLVGLLVFRPRRQKA